MRVFVILIGIWVGAITGGMLAGLDSLSRQRELFAVDLKRLELRVERLESKPVIFNTAVKVGDEVVIFNKKERGKVLAVNKDTLWVTFNPHRGPETWSIGDVALVKDAKE